MTHVIDIRSRIQAAPGIGGSKTRRRQRASSKSLTLPLLAPCVTSGRGVFEDTCFTPRGGFYLRAISARGICLRRIEVHTADEYEVACAQLWALLDKRDPHPELKLIR